MNRLGVWLTGFALAAGALPLHADEAPTILIEDVILTCPTDNLAAPLRAAEYEIHGQIAAQCRGETVCRLRADDFLAGPIVSAGCDEITIVPVCADDSGTLGAETGEMSLPLRNGATLAINCAGIANPHF